MVQTSKFHWSVWFFILQEISREYLNLGGIFFLTIESYTVFAAPPQVVPFFLFFLLKTILIYNFCCKKKVAFSQMTLWCKVSRKVPWQLKLRSVAMSWWVISSESERRKESQRKLRVQLIVEKSPQRKSFLFVLFRKCNMFWLHFCVDMIFKKKNIFKN